MIFTFGMLGFVAFFKWRVFVGMCGALQQLTIIPVVLIPFSFTMGHVAPPREKNAGQLEMGLAKRV